MESVIRDVPTLDEAQRRSLEALLGHELHDNQRLYVAVLSESGDLTDDERRRAWDQLNEVAAVGEDKLRAQGITAERWATIVDEECNAVRHGKKS